VTDAIRAATDTAGTVALLALLVVLLIAAPAATVWQWRRDPDLRQAISDAWATRDGASIPTKAVGVALVGVTLWFVGIAVLARCPEMRDLTARTDEEDTPL
jgi:type IV secretory pathway TrbD component